MSKIIKIVTDCAFCGCDRTHFVAVPDDATEKDIQEIANDFMMNDIEPSVVWEESSEEDAEDFGEDIEDLT